MSFWRCYYHLVWATRERAHIIQPALEDRLYGYLVNKAAELGVYVYALDGWYDHVHLVVSIPPKHSVAEVVRRLKGASSHYLNHDIGSETEFAWQRGYGVLSFGERQRPTAEAYVSAQKLHHRSQGGNAWLERCTDLDEGPEESGVAPGPIPGVAREEVTAYAAWGDPPF
jgi:REP element-mobilizing transposase RayT